MIIDNETEFNGYSPFDNLVDEPEIGAMVIVKESGAVDFIDEIEGDSIICKKGIYNKSDLDFVSPDW